MNFKVRKDFSYCEGIDLLQFLFQTNALKSEKRWILCPLRKKKKKGYVWHFIWGWLFGTGTSDLNVGGKRGLANTTESHVLSVCIVLTKKLKLSYPSLFLPPSDWCACAFSVLASDRMQKCWLHRSEQVLEKSGPTMYSGSCLHWYANKAQLVMKCMCCFTLSQVNPVWKKKKSLVAY